MRRFFTALLVLALVATSCGGSSPADVAQAPVAEAAEGEASAVDAQPTAVPAPATSAPATPVPVEPSPVAAAPVTDATVTTSPGAGPQDGPDGVWCQTWREIETDIDTTGLTDEQANEQRFASGIPLLQSVVAHAPADLGVDMNAYLEANLFVAAEGQAAGWDLLQLSDEAVAVLINTIDPLGSAIEDYNMQFCGIGDFTRPDARTEAPVAAPTTPPARVDARSPQIEMPANADDIFSEAEATAALNGQERAELLSPLMSTGLTEAQAECVMFVVLTTDILNQGDQAFDQVFIDCGA